MMSLSCDRHNKNYFHYFQKAKDSLITAGNKAANFTVDGFNKAKVGFQGLLNKDDVSTPVPAVAAPAA